MFGYTHPSSASDSHILYEKHIRLLDNSNRPPVVASVSVAVLSASFVVLARSTVEYIAGC